MPFGIDARSVISDSFRVRMHVESQRRYKKDAERPVRSFYVSATAVRKEGGRGGA